MASAFKPVVLELFQLTPNLAVEILPQGVTVHRIYVQADGRTHDLIIGPEKPSEYADPAHKYKNTIIGRYTNRIPVGEYTITSGSISSPFTAHANESPTTCLHGGPVGFDALPFQVLSGPQDLTLFSSAEKELLAKGSCPSYALFKHQSPAGDQGFPGILDIEVLVGLCPPSEEKTGVSNDETSLGSIFIVYRAKVSSDNNKPVVTPINITQHWGFNLDASLRGESTPTIKDHRLQIAADDILQLGPGFIATGKLTPVKGTSHDHTLATDVLAAKYPSSGYDDFYLFSKASNASGIAPGKVPIENLTDASFDLLSPILSNEATNPPVVLSSPKSGIKASFNTNQGGVQFWSCEPLKGSGAMKRIHGGTGEADGLNNGYKGGAAAFLEFHEPHAAWLHPDVVSNSISKNDTLLTSDQLYHNFVKVDLRFNTTLRAGTGTEL